MRVKRRVTLRFKLLILLACAVYAGLIFINQSSVLSDLETQKSDLQKQYAQAQMQYSELENEAQYMNSDAFIEKMAREKLGWVKEGELKFVQENK